MPLTESVNLVLANGEKTPVDKLGIGSVSLLLHGNADGSGNILDSSPSTKTVSKFGNAASATPPSYPNSNSAFGSAIAFDGDGDYLESAANIGFEFGINNFTVEMWVRPGNWSTDKFLVSSTAPGGFFFGTRNGGATNGLGIGRVGVAWDIETGVYPALNTWSHVAFVRNGSNLIIFNNGVSAGSTTTSNSYSLLSSQLQIGRLDVTRFFNGYIDELRITKGVARYTSNFTPPTAPFPDI